MKSTGEKILSGPPLRIGVSACLLGERVRYDGGGKLDPFLRDTIGRFVTFVPVCPETECGFGIPREAMHLVGKPSDPRMVTRVSGVDLTARLREWASRWLDSLDGEDLCGFVFKSRSPSCGMENVRMYRPEGGGGRGSGVFTLMMKERFPFLPMGDEVRLRDPEFRAGFFERAAALKRWRDLLREGKTAADLARFHSANGFLLMSHSASAHRALGKLVAAADSLPTDFLFDSYFQRFFAALRVRATAGKHRSVLLPIASSFRKPLSPEEREELLASIERFEAGDTPLSEPITLLGRFARKYRETSHMNEVYLNPHPAGLAIAKVEK